MRDRVGKDAFDDREPDAMLRGQPAPHVPCRVDGVHRIDDNVQAGSEALVGDRLGDDVGREAGLEARRDPRA